MPGQGSTPPARRRVVFTGFDKNKLPGIFICGFDKLIAIGGKGEMVVGDIKEVEIKSRANNPVHKSHFNRADKNEIIAVRLTGSWGSKIFHVFKDGSSTSSKFDVN